MKAQAQCGGNLEPHYRSPESESTLYEDTQVTYVPLKSETFCPTAHRKPPFPSTLGFPHLERDLGLRRLRDFMAYSILVSWTALDLGRKQKQLITVDWEGFRSLII